MPTVRTLVAVASGAYVANCALGAAVQSGLIDTSRRPHHALYIVTSTLTAVAMVAGMAERSPRALLLAPTLLPLAILPHVGHDAHAVTGLAAAPWYAAALLLGKD